MSITTVTLVPSRLGCPSLPGTMKGILMSLPGVSEVEIHYEERSLDVSFDPTLASVEVITKKIGDEMGLAMRARSDDASGGSETADTCPL